MPSEGGRRGRRDNGLDAAAYVPLVDVDPRVGEHLLDVLGSAGVPAYLEPSADVEPYTRALSLPSPPTDRLWVDRAQRREALDIVDAETPHGTRPRPDVRDDEPSHGLADSAEERAWREIVAAWDAPAAEPPTGRGRTGVSPVPPWPAGDEPLPDGPAGNGPAVDDPDRDGKPGAGPTGSGPAGKGPGGAAGYGPDRDRPAGDGPAGYGAAGYGPGRPPAGDGPDRDRPTGDGPAGYGPAGYGPGRPPAGHGPDRDRPAGYGPDRDGPAGYGTDRDGPAGYGTDRRPGGNGPGGDDPPGRARPVPTAADLDAAAEAAAAAREAREDEDDEVELTGPPELDEGHYEPPPPPPVPRPSRQALLGTLVIAIGIVLIAFPGVVGFDDRAGLTLGVFCVLGGGALLVLRLRETRADDGPDDGAVV